MRYKPGNLTKDYTPVIKKEHLRHGVYYEGRCRNATVARWDARTQQFYHWREKFGHVFLETIYCPEDEAHFDVFVADRILEKVVKEIPLPE